MSAFGFYAVLRRDGFRECVRLAADIRTEVTGIFQKQAQRGLDEFKAAWAAAFVEEFERSPAALALQKVFTAAMPFEETPASFPGFAEQPCAPFVGAAHKFYGRGLALVSEAHVVLFVIR